MQRVWNYQRHDDDDVNDIDDNDDQSSAPICNDKIAILCEQITYILKERKIETPNHEKGRG